MTDPRPAQTAKIPVALQLYTVRDDFARDPIGTLRAVAQVGYTAVEIAGLGGMTAPQLRKQLDDLGLAAPSIHIGLDDLRGRLNDALDEAQALGCTFVVCPWAPEEWRQDAAAYRRLAEILRGVGERCGERGIAFAYHNHNFEFERCDGQYGLDLLFDAAGTGVKSELDVYWAAFAGADPVSYIRHLGARCAVLHLKDMAKDESRTFAEIGAGRIDFAPIFDAARAAGTQLYVVEQDTCQHPPLESIRISLENLRAWGIA
jgi:sugar phosphate isomerase/epimerase